MKYSLYILYSHSLGKSYVGYTNNLHRRLIEHNNSTQRSFTSKGRPWVQLHYEEYEKKSDAMTREKWFKSGIGRVHKMSIIDSYLKK
jgi:putative endonuclease